MIHEFIENYKDGRNLLQVLGEVRGQVSPNFKASCISLIPWEWQGLPCHQVSEFPQLDISVRVI